jgi:hypothetical protein
VIRLVHRHVQQALFGSLCLLREKVKKLKSNVKRKINMKKERKHINSAYLASYSQLISDAASFLSSAMSM